MGGQDPNFIGDIYDAARDPAQWTSVLQRITQFVGGTAAVLYAKDTVRNTGRFVHIYGIETDFVQSYSDKYATLDPFTIPRFFSLGKVISTTDIMSHEEFQETTFFKGWAEPQGWIDFVSALLAKSDATYTECVVFLNGIVDHAARRKMELIVPHVRRAVLISDIIDLHRGEAAELGKTLDGIAAALFLVDADGRIVRANLSGHRMLQEKDVLTSVSGKLAACDQNGNRMLREVFAVAGGDHPTINKGVAVSLVAPNSEPYVAHVLPLTPGPRCKTGVANSAVAAVFVRKAMLDLPHPLVALANYYSLTPTQLTVLMTIVRVGSAPETAKMLGISQATVKTHLAHVFEKTSANRLADLVRIVAGFTSPLID